MLDFSLILNTQMIIAITTDIYNVLEQKSEERSPAAQPL